MKNKFNSLDKLIVQKLFQSEKIIISTEDELLKFNPISLMDSIKRITEHDLARIDGDGNITRSTDFFKISIKERWSIFRRQTPWKPPH
jgi:rRNA pseudouridine-1189 N-methylase Emg1 (Nep1/Mra1 family)